MPLSRHLYPLDDVHAALRYATGRSDPAMCVFWCQELMWSGCASEAVSTMFESWLWQVGPFRTAWLYSAWNALATEEVTEDAIRLAAYQLGTLSSSQRDHSLWQILVLGASAPEHLTRKTPVTLPSDDDKEIYLTRALYQGKARCAWWMAQYITPTRVWELLSWYATTLVSSDCRTVYETCLKALQEYDQLLGYRSDEYDVVVRCAAVLMMCLTPSQQAESVRPMAVALDARVAQRVGEWNAVCGRREARAYALHTGCLYGTTWRGKSRWSQHNRVQLHHVEPYLVDCPFWEDAIADHGVIVHGQIQWHSEDSMEAFYERYFPDDIPDEWTREEKQKSHGDGVLGPEETVSLCGYGTRFLCVPSRLTWGCLGEVRALQRSALALAEAQEGYHPSHIIHAYSPQVIPLDDAWLAPVHKIKRIE